MSANDWDICPRCKRLAHEERKRLEQAAKDAYGNVNRDIYESMKRKAEQPAAELKPTLREDWECYTDADGVMHANYYVNCERCGLNGEIRQTQQLDLSSKRKGQP